MRSGNPAYIYFPGREVREDYDLDEVSRRTLAWLKNCSDNHECMKKEVMPLPKRLIDVRPPDGSETPIVRQILGSCGHYIALSYVWGKNQTQMCLAPQSTLPMKIDLHLLPQTIRDAVSLTQKLRLRYLWVDTLCIEQGDGGDFSEEALKMRTYYSNAFLTVAAGCAGDSGGGFSKDPSQDSDRVELQYNRFHTSRQITQDESVFAYLERPWKYRSDPIRTRAWTLQESILSKRYLDLGSYQLRLTCTVARHEENGSSRRPDYDDMLQWNTNLLHPDLTARRLTALGRWYAFLREYTVRERGVEADKFTALAGIAEIMQEAIGSRYLFGICEADMARGLFWRGQDVMGSSGLVKRPLQLARNNVPSWSWAAYEGAVKCNFLQFGRGQFLRVNTKDTYFRVLNSTLICDSLDPIRGSSFGPCLDQLELEGTLLRVRRSREDRDFLKQRLELSFSFSLYTDTTRMIPLEAIDDEIKLDKGASEDTMEDSVRTIVALGVLDIVSEYRVDNFRCLWLLTKGGLLIAPTGDGKYRRVGFFKTKEEIWPEGLLPMKVTLV